MLTDELVRDVRFRVNIFQSRIYSSDAVDGDMGEYISSWRKQESPWVYNTHQDMNAVADVSRAEHASLGRRPCECCQL